MALATHLRRCLDGDRAWSVSTDDVQRTSLVGPSRPAGYVVFVPDDRGQSDALQVLSGPLGGSPLVRDGRVADTASGWYAAPPANADAWRARSEQVRGTVHSAWAEALAPAIAARGAAAERLERSAGGRGVLVTTGQQPGLFGGPLYTWWKALTALALADRLENETGVPHAPVFWAATDDSDFAEAAETFVAVRGGLERLALPSRVTNGERLIDIPLGTVDGLVQRLAAGAGASTHPQALEAVAAAYHDGETIGGAYLALLRGVLEPLGISVLDASHAAVRSAGRPLLRDALRDAAAIEQALLARETAIRSAGFRPQVPVVRGRSLVFASRKGARERVALAMAARVAGADDHTLGPNVLLRPIMERAILPTTAYVAGPGELAYFAQMSAVAEVLGAEMPLAVPRWSGMVIEPHVRRLLDRYALDVEALEDPHAAEGAVAREALPPDVRAALGRLRGATTASIEALATAVRESGTPALPATVLTGAARDVERRLARLERRIVAAAKREQSAAMTDLATLRAALRPSGKPQERVLNLFPLLARHGPALLDAVYRAASAHAAGLVPGAPVPRPPASEPLGTGARERTG